MTRSDQYYYADANRSAQGPYTLAQLRQLHSREVMGITLMSAGSHTEPGGYTGAGRNNLHLTERGRIIEMTEISSQWATGQFDIADERTPADVAHSILRLGYEPVWKDWDAALTA